jgi:transmembrane sensor
MKSEDKNFEDLMIDYLSGTISEKDQQHLSELLKSNRDIKMRFDEMLKIRAMSYVPDIESQKHSNYHKILEQINDMPTFNSSHSWFSNFRNIAAIIALVISVSVASYYIYSDISSPADTAFQYETFSPIGSQTKIILPDSTVVWLNSGSSLKYNRAFSKKNREVTLIGEGYFEVAKNKSKPFYVHTDSLDVRVLGTTFNVKAYNDDVNVIVNLIEGSVDVSLPKSNNEGSLLMKPNERIVFNKQTKKIESSEVDAYRSAQWTTGKLCFVDATLEQISKDLERKYYVKIQIANDKIKNELFSGSLNLNLSLIEVLSYIDVDKKFIVNQSNDTIYIGIKQ